MRDPRRNRNASSWFFYLFLIAGLHNTTTGWVQAQEISFITAKRFAAGVEPVGVAVGDFNQDGNRDLAVVNRGSNNVSVLLGNGNGAFQTAVNYPIGGFASPASIIVSYFNGDSIPDLAVGAGTSVWMQQASRCCLEMETGRSGRPQSLTSEVLLIHWPWLI